MHNVFLLLGSNLGNRQLFLEQAIVHIEAEAGQALKMSSVYESPSWGKTDAPAYLNQVIYLQTSLNPRALLKTVLTIEQVLGREREEKWGPRTIDIDILFYDELIINENDLKVPHPELHKRGFTMVPLAEIAPDLIHPVLNKNILQIKSELNDEFIVKSYNFEKI
jgi:2-amino-4-hydroxy-6-hydroxymethyldihydropteridine diphosphokinase